jgi:hypothetical protein
MLPMSAEFLFHACFARLSEGGSRCLAGFAAFAQVLGKESHANPAILQDLNRLSGRVFSH